MVIFNLMGPCVTYSLLGIGPLYMLAGEVGGDHLEIQLMLFLYHNCISCFSHWLHCGEGLHLGYPWAQSNNSPSIVPLLRPMFFAV